jgi:hypothetical protein
MTAYATAAPAATPARRSHTLESLQALSSHLEDLKFRMRCALDAIARDAGAWHCESCGEWTLESIPLTSTDEFGRDEEGTFCKRCVPASYCPF